MIERDSNTIRMVLKKNEELGYFIMQMLSNRTKQQTNASHAPSSIYRPPDPKTPCMQQMPPRIIAESQDMNR
jgi:hypothetical protein